MQFDLSALIKAIPALLYGASVTLRITVLSIAMGLVIVSTYCRDIIVFPSVISF
ncbi:MAG TPA: hypothetical protein PK171_02775 [Atribacter sp.]|nr:hypothetical protein [Atribacter sp.]